jgi:hypothetical protein
MPVGIEIIVPLTITISSTLIWFFGGAYFGVWLPKTRLLSQSTFQKHNLWIVLLWPVTIIILFASFLIRKQGNKHLYKLDQDDLIKYMSDAGYSKSEIDSSIEEINRLLSIECGEG